MSDCGPEDESQLPSPTMPGDISVCLRGFESREDAERFGETIVGAVHLISRYIDLARLDGITVAFDYDDALAQLDRGIQCSQPLKRTAEDNSLGVGMTPAVLRSGVVKAHMLFWAPTMLLLEDPSDERIQLAGYILAHECGHVEDLKNRDMCFPGTIFPPIKTDPIEAILERFAGLLWEEYAACRASARFRREQAGWYEECLISVLPQARERANAAIRSYRVHEISIDQVLEEAGSRLCTPLRYAAYLIGHLDGWSADFDEVPSARDLLFGGSYEPFVNRLRDVLRSLWSRRGQWTSTSEFDPLRAIVRDLVADGGMILKPLPDGNVYVDIPFTPETIP